MVLVSIINGSHMKKIIIVEVCCSMLILLAACGIKDSINMDDPNRYEELITDTAFDKRAVATIESILITEDNYNNLTPITWMPGQYLINKSNLYIDTLQTELKFFIDDLEIENRVPGYFYLQKEYKISKINFRLKDANVDSIYYQIKLDGSSTSGKWCQVVIEEIKTGTKYLVEGNEIKAYYFPMLSFLPEKKFTLQLLATIPINNNLSFKTVLIIMKIKY